MNIKALKRLISSFVFGFVLVLALGVALSSATPTSIPRSLNTGQHFLPPYNNPRDRLGFDSGSLTGYDVAQLHAGWYSNWSAGSTPAHPDQLVYVQLVKLHAGDDPHDPDLVRVTPSKAALASIAAANPGSLWLIGNEPDSLYQGDPIRPEVYAIVYADLYQYIKNIDPQALVANGGIVQPTPCRLEYLDIVWDTYLETFGEPMPVDVWNIHAFVLREVYGSWGASTPPGVDPSCGIDYAVDDADDMDIFYDNLIAMRTWMRDKGYQDKPLIISEYGILWPQWFAPQFTPTRVAHFMTSTFELFLNEPDLDMGYPADDYRLVQAWAWYSLSDDYYNGALFDKGSKAITTLGQVYADYAQSLDDTLFTDFTVWLAVDQPPVIESTTVEQSLSVPVRAYMGNLGKIAAPDALMRLEVTTDQGQSLILGRDETHDVPARFAGVAVMSPLTVALTVPGVYQFSLAADPQGQVDEPREWNNVTTVTLDLRHDWQAVSVGQQLLTALLTSETLLLTASVQNIGYWASPATSATFHLAASGLADTLITVSLPALDVGAAVELSSSVTLYDPGDYELGLVIDPDNQTGDRNEWNNVVTTTVNLYPDLTPLDLSYHLSGPAVQSGTLTLTATIHNRGNWPSAPVSVTANLQTVPQGTLLVPQDTWLTSLTAGAQISLLMDLAWPQPEQDLYQLTLALDAANRLPESDEQNNQISTTVPVILRFTLYPTATGIFSTPGESLSFVFPAGLVEQPLDIVYTPFLAAEQVGDRIQASDLGFSLAAFLTPTLPFSITWHYTPADLGDLQEANLRLFVRDSNGRWLDAACQPYQRDTAIRVGVCQLGAFVFGNGYSLYLPLIRRDGEASSYETVLWPPKPNSPLRLPPLQNIKP